MSEARASKSAAKSKQKTEPKSEHAHGSPHSPVDRDTPEREKVRSRWKRGEPRR